jgi:hypothetical protein
MEFSTVFRIKRDGLRPVVRTTAEALRLIDEELPMELRGLPRWTFARELLVAADKSRRSRNNDIAVLWTTSRERVINLRPRHSA